MLDRQVFKLVCKGRIKMFLGLIQCIHSAPHSTFSVRELQVQTGKLTTKTAHFGVKLSHLVNSGHIQKNHRFVIACAYIFQNYSAIAQATKSIFTTVAFLLNASSAFHASAFRSAILHFTTAFDGSTSSVQSLIIFSSKECLFAKTFATVKNANCEAGQTLCGRHSSRTTLHDAYH
eukprot:INCI13471.7.p1 GENE.INCI13471.7~~INCI13471.7.p1  ORF type:complete len:176 (-),score=10.69 INCI13471.7:7-534(-)